MLFQDKYKANMPYATLAIKISCTQKDFMEPANLHYIYIMSWRFADGRLPFELKKITSSWPSDEILD